MNTLTVARARELLDAMAEVRVGVVGDLMLDRYISGDVDRISPEAPVPVVRVAEETWAVGGAGNVAANAVALGASCEVVGLVGRDEHGRVLSEALADRGVSTRGVVEGAARPTTVKTRVLARRQQIVRVDSEVDDDADEALSARLCEAVERLARECDVLAMEDYNKGVLVPAVIRTGVEAARSRGVPTVVDPKKLRFFEYGGVTVFKPNRKELEDALSDHVHPDDPAWMERTRMRLECDNLMLTLGERGIALAAADGSSLRVPAVARSVYDVSGAGDTVTAVVAATLGAGGSPREAAVFANHAAAIEVGKAGVATVSPEEILVQIEHFEESPE